MRIMIIGLNFAPEPVGVGKYTGEMAIWLAASGHDVSVVTTRPYYPEWKKAPLPGRWLWRGETWCGCRVVRCPLYVPGRMSGLRRIVHHLSFALSCIPPALLSLFNRKPDIVVAIAPSLLTAPVALLLARLTGAKAWLHVQDLEIDAAASLGILRHRRLIAAGLIAERWVMRRFDLVSAVSAKMLDAIAAKDAAPKSCVLFPNWVDTKKIFPLTGSSAMRRELGIPEGSCVALYSGSMGRKQGLNYIIEAARILAANPKTSPLFLLAGAGPIRAELESAARDLSNVRFLPLQPDERFNEFLNIGDIHLLPQLRDANDLVMPSKLGAMLAVGKPVVATVPADSQIALTIGDAGFVVPPENPAALADAIRVLAGDANRRQAMGAAALRVVRDSLQAEPVLTEMEGRLHVLAATC